MLARPDSISALAAGAVGWSGSGGSNMNEDMDALALASRSAQNKVDGQNLWRAVMTLPVWYFIAQGQADQAEPMVASVDGRAQLLAFTDEDRAEAFARHIAGKRGGEA